jgi:MoaA/NifB/PqqE/SkfB family radical SAM enzyme
MPPMMCTSSVRLNISIDGPREIHDDLRGAGNLDKSVATARECVRRKIAVSFSGVILRENLHHHGALVDIAAEVGVTDVSLQPFQVEIAGLHKDVARFSSRSVERDSIARALTTLCEYAASRKITIYTEGLFGVVPDYLVYGKRPIPTGGCVVPSTMLMVDWRGDVYPCFFMWKEPDRMGNVYRDRLHDLALAHTQATSNACAYSALPRMSGGLLRCEIVYRQCS